jgi:hypothetical protein
LVLSRRGVKWKKDVENTISKRAGENNLSQAVIEKLCSVLQIRVDNQIFAAPVILILSK